ncbi:MAG: S8 family serine peptidase [Chloroflexi bacterium]|nr:S8 family serine peptidase [Chloroflexota bacterium]
MSMRRMRSILAATLAIAVVLGATPLTAQRAEAQRGGPPEPAIVVLSDAVADPGAVADEHARAHGFRVTYVYEAALKGYAAALPRPARDAIARDPRVEFVSEDREVRAFDTLPTGVDRVDAEAATGGSFAPTPGFGVAVLDTGIDLSHPDLNAKAGKACVAAGPRGTPQDYNGHGTHVAGTIGARNNGSGVVGVAPGIAVWAVKVLNDRGSGSWSTIICGIDWVTKNAASKNIKVANMSLGGGGADDGNCGFSNKDALHKAICKSVSSAGVTYAVAAGNDGANLAGAVPAAYNEVIAVTALADYNGQPGGGAAPTCANYGADDTFASFSNYAGAADQAHTVGAPGACILSTYVGGGYATGSGTSMASPHAAGAAALYLASHPGATPAQVLEALRASGEANGAGHSDPSGLHPEPVVQADAAYQAP